MAKGVEDNAFYRYTRLTVLTEVGADPCRFAVTPADFHAAQAARLASWPAGMTALSTHDTKRGEDVRARISVLSEFPDEWAAAVRRWLRIPRWPIPRWPTCSGRPPSAPGRSNRDRLQGYAEKAAREAGNPTRWTDPDAAFEAAAARPGGRLLRPTAVIAPDWPRWPRSPVAGWSNSLAAKLIQLTVPGVPDVYQGTELLGPLAGRPGQPAAGGLRRAAGDPARPASTPAGGRRSTIDGAAKLLVTDRALRLRRDRPELFTGYHPLLGQRCRPPSHLVAFDRGGAITFATRLPLGLQTPRRLARHRPRLPPGCGVTR